MKRRLVQLLLCAGLAAVAAATALTLPAAAQKRTIYVELNGQLVPIEVDVPPGTPLSDIQIPGLSQPPSAPPAAQGEPPPASGSQPSGTRRRAGGPVRRPATRRRRKLGSAPTNTLTGGTRARPRPPTAPALRNADGSPTPSNPGFMLALPGPSYSTGVPNFVIERFKVPIFLLPIYQAAGIQYGVRWEVLAAINEIETNFGLNLKVSSAGALGWMQFIPSSWKMYGVDANRDGVKDPFNPVDAIFAAANYLDAAGYEKDPDRAIFAYNHADWYVDSVKLRARLIAGVPPDLIGSLTGLTEGQFPVAARARYADDVREKEARGRIKRGQNRRTSKDGRRSVEIFAKTGSPIVATNDGVIKKIGHKPKLGRYIVLQDVYGNRYMYSGVGTVVKHYPVPKEDARDPKKAATALSANARARKPQKPASAGRQPEADDSRPKPGTDRRPRASLPVKERLFAHPNLPGAREAGGLEQLLDSKLGGKGRFETYRNYFSRPFGVDAKDVRLRRLKVGSKVIGGTILARVGKPEGTKASHVEFEIRPSGKGAPSIDPIPIINGWKLLEATKIHRAAGKNVLYGDDEGAGLSIGQIMMLPKPKLEQSVLSDPRIEIYGCGRKDVRSGQIDRRVLVALKHLALSRLRPTVTSLKCGHGFFTASGKVSHHSSGSAVDIAKINGIPVQGNQDPGNVVDHAIRALRQLRGHMAPDQIISLRDYGGTTIAMRDHHSHVHVGFRPLFGENTKLGAQARVVLKRGQWSDLLSRLRAMPAREVPPAPSKYAIPVKKKKQRASRAHQGE